MADYESVADLFAGIEAERAHLRDALSGKDEAGLHERPEAHKWSVMENARHLVFAEYAHFARFVSDGQWWRKLEPLPPHRLEVHLRLKMVGTEATSLKALLETWDAVHETTRELLNNDTEEVRRALTRHRTHLRTHVKKVESLLKARK